MRWLSLLHTIRYASGNQYPKCSITEKQVISWWLYSYKLLQEAKTLPGVGERLADKIWEISESGNLQKLQEMSANEQVTVLELFQGVWGAGAATARAWVTIISESLLLVTKF